MILIVYHMWICAQVILIMWNLGIYWFLTISSLFRSDGYHYIIKIKQENF